MKTYCVLDLETTYSEHYGRVSNPFIAENKVVRCGAMYSDNAPFEFNFRNAVDQLKLYHLNGTLFPVILENLYNFILCTALTRRVVITNRIPSKIFDYDIICCHNSKFELLWLLRYHEKATLEWIKRGGVLWCTQFTEYQLSGKINKLPSLTKLAPVYGGYTKHDKIKEYWKSGIRTEDMPLWELDYYLHYDVHNTWTIFRQQYSKVRQQGLLISLYHHFISMCYTGLCEHYGMCLDKDKLEELREESIAAKSQYFEQMQGILVKLLPIEALEYLNLNSNDHISTLLYGGIFKYSIATPHIYKTGAKKGQTYNRYEHHSVEVKGLGLELTEEAETKKEGVGKTNRKTLEWIKGVPFIDLLLQYRKHEQLLKTFLNPDGGGVLGLLHPDGRIHSSLTHAYTSTGRLNSRAPNIQNIAKAGALKTAFMSRYKEGFIVEADWAGLENCTMAQVSGDENLILDLWDGVDLHCKRAAAMNKISYEEIFNNKNLPEYAFMRSKAKGPSFAYAYRAGKRKLMEETHLSEQDITDFINSNKELYPKTVSFYDDLYEISKSKAVPTKDLTKEGNTRETTTYATLLGWSIVFTSDDSPLWAIARECSYKLGRYHPYTILVRELKEKDRLKMYPKHPDAIAAGVKYTSFTNTVFANYPNQNLADEIVKIFMSLLLTQCIDYTILGKIVPINTIHDSYLFDVCDEEHVQILLSIIRDCENKIIPYLQKIFKIKIKVPLKLDVKFSKTWKAVEEE